MLLIPDWLKGSRKSDSNSTNTERSWERVDYRELDLEYYQKAFDAQANCIHCVSFREERRVLWKKNRTDFCFVNSPEWPDARKCFLYRVRTFPHTNSGWDDKGSRA